MPALQGLKPEKAEKKLMEIQKGGALLEEHPALPPERQCQDCFWAFAFFATLGAVIVCGFTYSSKMYAAVDHNRDHWKDGMDFPPLWVLLAVANAATVGALGASFLFIMFAHRQPGCVVWTSLFFGPFVCFSVGLVLLGLDLNGVCPGGAIVGLVCIAVAICNAACVMCCWRRLIPFMIVMTEMVSEVIEQNPCMLFVGVIGGFMSLVYTLVVGIAAVGILMENREKFNSGKDSRPTMYAFGFVLTLVLVWGGLVCSNFCHVSYCGVFARWYYEQGDGSRVRQGKFMPSLNAAVKGLGSICFGSFLVAFVNALEQVVSMMRRDAAEDGNYVLCVVLCIIECFISCIGDILEYFNEWAFVQVAVRGTSFITSARITYSMISCANVQLIISDLLLNSLVTFGSLLCAFSGAGAGALAGYLLDKTGAAAGGGGMGFAVGCLAGSCAVNVVSSGVKCLLSCWANDPKPMTLISSETNDMFNEKIADKLHPQ